MGKIGNIVISGGVGDFVTYLTRLPDFKRQHSLDSAFITFTGGWKDTWKKVKEMAIPYPELIEDVSLGLPVKADLTEDWRPDNAPLKYKMQIPFKFNTMFTDEIELPKEKYACIQPVTAGGNFDGFQAGRYLESQKWITICDKLRKDGYKIVLLGGPSDANYLPKGCYDVDLCGSISIRSTVYAINHCGLFIGTNSWMWQCSAYQGIPTVCLYYTNTHWIRIHTPLEGAPSWGLDKCYIETDKNIDTILGYMDELNG